MRGAFSNVRLYPMFAMCLNITPRRTELVAFASVKDERPVVGPGLPILDSKLQGKLCSACISRYPRSSWWGSGVHGSWRNFGIASRILAFARLVEDQTQSGACGGDSSKCHSRPTKRKTS